jgi:hypothetical protein
MAVYLIILNSGTFPLRGKSSPQQFSIRPRSDFDQKSNSDRLDDSRGGYKVLAGRVAGLKADLFV